MPQLGEYYFKQLNPEQKRRVVAQRAERIFLDRTFYERREDWVRAAGQLSEFTGKEYLSVHEIRPFAETECRERFAREARDGKAEQSKAIADWIAAERQLNGANVTVNLPVTAVPQLLPLSTIPMAPS